MPYNRLCPIEANVRKSRGTAAYKAGIEKLAASILALHKLTGQGLLQNLVVNMVGELGGVVAGGRRFDAIGLLIERGEFPDTYPVPVQVVADDAVTAASLTENFQREAMHPADEFDAFLALVEQGWSIDTIADAFGVTPLVVERRLKLRAAAPALLEDYRAGLLTTDQLIALCSTDNHERQMAVWSRVREYESTYMRNPAELRKAVMDTEVDAAKDPRVAFIGGIEAYESAGGKVRRDLFAVDGDGVILEDSALLESLVSDRLKVIDAEVAAEGWGWTEMWTQMDWTTYSRYGKAPTITIELSDEAQAELAALEARLSEVETSVDQLMTGDENQSEENDAALEALNDEHSELTGKIKALNASAVTVDPAVIEHCGALVIYERGAVRFERGLVRSADRQKVKAVLGEGSQVAGGRESEPAGRKADAISDALRKSLLGYKNMAAQSMTAKNASAAKILFVCKFVSDIRGTYGVAPTDLSVTNGYGTRAYCASDEAGEGMQSDFESAGHALIEALPKDPCEMWDVLSTMKAVEIDRLLAYAVARSVSLSEKNGGLSAKYLEALGLDMADHFTPTAENYLGRVSKDLILQALTEAGKVADDEDRSALLAMKKGPLAKEAESRLVGTGWVPELIRTVNKQIETKGKKARKAA
jgi:ParB family chromosome partitioning protein